MTMNDATLAGSLDAADLYEPPLCGELYPREKVAGDPVPACIRFEHGENEKHQDENGFEWYG
jgi:hypothetical protein